MTDLIAAIRAEGSALVGAAERDLSAAIARYPGWTELDLLIHTGSVHRRTTETIITGATERVGRVFPPDEEPATVLPWFRQGAEELVVALTTADPALRVWGFGPRPGVAAWTARMALETTVHRWDAERPFGEPAPLDPDLAILGLDEFAELWSGGIAVPEGAGALCLRVIDSGDSWLLNPADGGISLARGEAAAALTGTAGSLYLWVLGRIPMADLDATADASPWDAALRAIPDAKR